MQAVPFDPSVLVKTHSQERTLLRFCNISVKKKVFIFIAFCFQIVVFYACISPEVSMLWSNSKSYNILTRSTINNTLCRNGTCPSENKYSKGNDSSSFATEHFEHNQTTTATATNDSSSFATEHFEHNQTTTATATTDKNNNDLQEEKLTTNQTTKSADNKSTAVFPKCSNKPPGLQGALDISFAHKAYELKQIEEDNPLVSSGGYFKPPFCKALWKVAIIIPFRDRDEHLQYFLQYMHPILQRQQLEYRIYIVNQHGTGKFNRAKLMNIGYAESIKDLDFGCFAFHDVDLILENDHAIYSCPEKPRHLSVAVDKFNYKLPYSAIFGGVTELTKKQFEAVNGYSNSFWGWGGEDDDMYNRVKINHMSISRYSETISRYRMISHAREKGNEPNPERFGLIRQTSKAMRTDGLNSLKYKVVQRDDNVLFTNITVDVFGPP